MRNFVYLEDFEISTTSVDERVADMVRETTRIGGSESSPALA